MVIQPLLPQRADVLVVGGGPAGLAAAIAARKVGLSVIVADRAAPEIDKACGEGLMPDAVATLGRLGISLGPEHGAVFRGIRFVEGRRAAEAIFAHGYGLGIRRTALHRMLVDRARDLDVGLRWCADVALLESGDVSIDGHALHCRWIVGADGIHSRLRRISSLGTAWQGRRRTGVRQHFAMRPWTDLVEVHWHSGFQAYVTPVGPERICVALIGEHAPPSFADLPKLFPGLAALLKNAAPEGQMRGAISVSRRLRSVTKGHLALVGDASGSVDAITGEGMALAFRQAEILAAALADEDPGRYQAQHRALGRMPLMMSRLLLLMTRQDRLRGAALRLLAAQPWIFDRLLALHVGRPQQREIDQKPRQSGVPAFGP